MKRTLLVILLLAPNLAVAATSGDRTAATLQSCLDSPSNAATSGQVDCEAAAAKRYDQRMNSAYTALLRALPAKAAQQLQQSQRAWLAFRDAEGTAASALFATRQGTMYVPMQAGATTTITRDRALQLENYLRIISIEN